jgi:SAM-dependent methyltransferase
MHSFHNESEFLEHWKFPPLFHSELRDVERTWASGFSMPPCEALCGLPLEIFAALTLGVPDSMPFTQRRLPMMAPDQVQQDWTGNSGWPLMAQSLDFIRTMVQMRAELPGPPIGQCRILDFGCGWGRLLRLLLKFAPEGNLFGVDPWDKSIALCREHGLRCGLAQSGFLPKSLPFPGPFDIVFAYSVFTHLSANAARLALSTLRASIARTGFLCITIRPVEYWKNHGGEISRQMEEAHAKSGFAFLPHKLAPIEGEITYGDTSMSLDALQRLAPGWRISKTCLSLLDPLQCVVVLTPASE